MAKYDIYIQPENPDITSNYVTKIYSFGPGATMGIKGLQALINMFALELLTPIGTDPLDPERGTPLPGLIGSNVRPEDAVDVVQISIEQTVDRINKNQKNRQVPADQRLLSAQLTDFYVDAAAPGFTASIYIQNSLRKGLVFNLPMLQST